MNRKSGDDIAGEIKSVELNMGEGMKQGDATGWAPRFTTF